MSMSKASMKSRDYHLKLLRELQAEGSLEDLIHTVRREALSARPSGSMSDASKRRCPSEPEEDDDFVAVSYTSSAAAADVPFPSRSSPTVYEEPTVKNSPEELPEGIGSMDEWGRTLCELPRVKHFNMSYAELVHQANTGNEEIEDYLGWVRRHNGPSTRVHDLKKYVMARDKEAGYVRKTYPGSKEVRKLK